MLRKSQRWLTRVGPTIVLVVVLGVFGVCLAYALFCLGYVLINGEFPS